MAALSGNRPENISRPSTGATNILAQSIRVTKGMVSMQLIPPVFYHTTHRKNDMYMFRITLRSGRPANKAGMQYLNNYIRNGFSAVQGNHPLHLICCERIPGINQQECFYLACFNKPAVSFGQEDLKLTVNDTVSGYGLNCFTIQGSALDSFYATNREK